MFPAWLFVDGFGALIDGVGLLYEGKGPLFDGGTLFPWLFDGGMLLGEICPLFPVFDDGVGDGTLFSDDGALGLLFVGVCPLFDETIVDGGAPVFDGGATVFVDGGVPTFVNGGTPAFDGCASGVKLLLGGTIPDGGAELLDEL